MNVLLTGAGRRNYLIAALKSAVGPGGQVIACDMRADAPALQQADRGFLVPPVDGPGYLDALLQICEFEQIGLLIPSLEPELWLLATHRAQFAALGTVAVVASPKIGTETVFTIGVFPLLLTAKAWLYGPPNGTMSVTV